MSGVRGYSGEKIRLSKVAWRFVSWANMNLRIWTRALEVINPVSAVRTVEGGEPPSLLRNRERSRLAAPATQASE